MLKGLLKGLFAKKETATEKMVRELMEQNAKLMQQINTKNEIKPVINTNIAPNATELSKNEADDYNNNANRDSFAVKRNRADETIKALDWKSIQRLEDSKDVIDSIMSAIKDAVYTSLPSAYYDVLMKGDFQNEWLENYLRFKMINKGEYHPESSNLEAYSKSEVCTLIAEYETLDWEQRQLARGKNPYASKKQLQVCKDNGIDTSKIKYWFQASKALELVFGVRDNNPSKAQLDKIAELSAKLCISANNMKEVKDRKEASEEIERLLDLDEEVNGAEHHTAEQEEIYRRYAKLLGKRATKSAKEHMDSLSKRAMSKEIDEMKKAYYEANPNCTEGQANFIMSLCDQVGMEYNPEEIKALSRAGATNKITMLKREQLYKKMKFENSSITRAEINKLTRDEVDMKLKEYQPQR